MPALKLHIVFISTWFPEPGNTSGSFTSEQADALIRKGHKVTVFMFRYFSLLSWLKKKIKGEPLSSWLKGAFIVPIACNFVNFFPSRFSSNPLLAEKKAFLRYIQKRFSGYINENGNPDIIHHHGTSDYCYITAYLSKQFDIPYIITEHSPFTKEKMNHFSPYETMEERISVIRNAAGRIAVSSVYKKRYEELFGVSFRVIPNLVNNEFSVTPLRQFPKPANPFNFLAIGALSEVKRHDILIKAFAAAFKNTPEVHLSIAGVGHLEQNYRNLIASLGVEGQVHLVGHKTRQEILALLDKSHIQVVSSEHETFCIAAVEALFRGNPVLSTRCGGPEDYITEQNGLLCNVNDVDDVKEKLLNIYCKYPSYNNTQIALSAKELYSEGAVVTELEKLYQKVISPA